MQSFSPQDYFYAEVYTINNQCEFGKREVLNLDISEMMVKKC